MNKVFYLFILDVYFYTLQWKRKTVLIVKNIYISKTQVFYKQKTVLLPLLRKAMAHENTALFHLDSDGSKKDII